MVIVIITYLESDHLHAEGWGVEVYGFWHTFHC